MGARRLSKKVADRRIRTLLVIFAVVFGITLARAVWLQTVRAGDLSRRGATQQHDTLTIPAGRGTIFDRTGVQLAIGEQATTVYANPRQIANPKKVAAAAAEMLGLDEATVATALADRSRGFVYVERQADPEKAAELESHHLAGLGFYPEERRAYPLGRVASQVLGYAGVDNRGLAGLELQLDRQLAGRPGQETVIKDPRGRALDVLSSVPERDGHNVFLTIDHTIQADAEGVLASAVEQWHAKRATAIVLDPHTGGILAMASAPGFDANAYPRVSVDLQRNRAVTDTYEPGSTFKLVTVSGVVSDHLDSATTAYTLPYSINVADRVIHDAEVRGTEMLTVGQILSHSSNVGAVTLAERLGPTRLSQWITRFGFGRDTGIDFPGESPGIVLPLERWSGSTIGTVPIGQGIAVTPLQVAAAYGAVANRGIWLTPHLVHHIVDGPRQNVARRRVLTPSISRQVLSMLVNVVDEGTGIEAAVPGYVVAGKTGTAAKPDPATGGYSTSSYVASFVGMVPATQPRLVILVAVDEPQGAIWGGVVAAPVFRDIARFALQYLEVPPDNPASLRSASSSG